MVRKHEEKRTKQIISTKLRQSKHENISIHK